VEVKRVVEACRRVAPGVVVLALVAAVAWLAGTLVPVVHPLLLAIVAGFLLQHLGWITPSLRAGVATHRLWLATGIVLLGASLSVGQLREGGLVVLVAVVGVTLLTLVLVELLARLVFDVNETLGSLLAAGSSVCGVSAVVAVASAVEADESHLAYAAGTVVLFDAVTLVVFPLVGEALGLSAVAFGIWAGVSMFSTGPVVAAGFVHSEAAGQWATVTKLARNTLIGAVTVAYVLYYTHRRSRPSSDATPAPAGSATAAGTVGLLWREFPTFVLGFFVLIGVASTGLLTDGQVDAIETVYGWCFMLAFVGLGTDLEVAKIRHSGLKPIAVVLSALVIASTLSLVAIVAALG